MGTWQDRLKLLRESRNFKTQKEFCYYAKSYGFNIDVVRYGRIERGVVVPDINEVVDICSALKISSDAWLFGIDSRVDLKGLDSKEIAIVAKIADMLRDLK